MASCSISGWDGSEGRTMTLTVTQSHNEGDARETVNMKVDISGGVSNYYDSHLNVWSKDMDTEATYDYFDEYGTWDSYKWFCTKGGSKTFTDYWTRKKTTRSVRVYITGYARTYSDRSNYVAITIPAIDSYDVTYNANGGSGAPAAQKKWYGESLKLQTGTPSRTGYTFAGWNTKSDGTGTNYSAGETYTANEALTLYAKWTAHTYSVQYNANGGSGAPAAQTKTYGVNLTLRSEIPTRTGYTFAGWNTKSDGTGTDYSAGGTYTSNAALTLYAKWTANPYTVSWNANGGSVTPESQTVYYDSSIRTLPVPTRLGYEFLGWFTDETGGSIISESTKPQGNKTYYAHWKLQSAGYISVGLEFKKAICYVSTEDGWKIAMPYISTEDGWKNSIL